MEAYTVDVQVKESQFSGGRSVKETYRYLYVDVDGKEHKGTTAGEVFEAPPPPPAPYQRGKYNVTGLGEQLLRAGPNGAVAYIGCNTGSQPCESIGADRHAR